MGAHSSKAQRIVSRKCMPGVGFEPTRAEAPGILSPLRLPFRHPGGSMQYKGSLEVGDKAPAVTPAKSLGPGRASETRIGRILPRLLLDKHLTHSNPHLFCVDIY